MYKTIPCLPSKTLLKVLNVVLLRGISQVNLQHSHPWRSLIAISHAKRSGTSALAAAGAPPALRLWIPNLSAYPVVSAKCCR